MQFDGVEEVLVFEVGQGFFDVCPVGVLGEDCPCDDFDSGLARPPVLWAEGVEEQLVYLV